MTCNSTDYAATEVLAAQLCSPLYARNAPLSSAVSSAIAYATAAARAATDGKNASDVASLPVCAVRPLSPSFLSSHFFSAILLPPPMQGGLTPNLRDIRTD